MCDGDRRSVVVGVGHCNCRCGERLVFGLATSSWLEAAFSAPGTERLRAPTHGGFEGTIWEPPHGKNSHRATAISKTSNDYHLSYATRVTGDFAKHAKTRRPWVPRRWPMGIKGLWAPSTLIVPPIPLTEEPLGGKRPSRRNLFLARVSCFLPFPCHEDCM